MAHHPTLTAAEKALAARGYKVTEANITAHNPTTHQPDKTYRPKNALPGTGNILSRAHFNACLLATRAEGSDTRDIYMEITIEGPGGTDIVRCTTTAYSDACAGHLADDYESDTPFASRVTTRMAHALLAAAHALPRA